MDGRRTSRGVARCALALVVCLLWAGKAGATFRYGDIQISGNIQTQNLFRIQNGTDTFHAFGTMAPGSDERAIINRARPADATM